MHIKLLLGKELFVTVFASVVISSLVPLFTETELLLVFEFPATCLTAEICFTCVSRHVVPGEYDCDAKEQYHHDEKLSIHAKYCKKRYLPQHCNTPAHKVTAKVRARMSGSSCFS